MTQLSVVRAPRAFLARLAVPPTNERSRSVFAGALLQAVVAFVIAGQFPVELFLLAPILFGVPHVVADLRHLVLRRALPGWWRRTVLLGCALLLGLLGCGVAIVALLVAACVQLQQSRAVYLSLANLHVYLELVMLTYFWVAAGRSDQPPPGSPRYASGV